MLLKIIIVTFFRLGSTKCDNRGNAMISRINKETRKQCEHWTSSITPYFFQSAGLFITFICLHHLWWPNHCLHDWPPPRIDIYMMPLSDDFQMSKGVEPKSSGPRSRGISTSIDAAILSFRKKYWMLLPTRELKENRISPSRYSQYEKGIGQHPDAILTYGSSLSRGAMVMTNQMKWEVSFWFTASLLLWIIERNDVLCIE